MATVHMVCGFLGAGKTTFSKTLATAGSAIHISIDDLYLRLFADGPTYELDSRAMDRLLGVVNDLWPLVAGAGADVVLDFGFWNRALRDDVRRLARLVNCQTRLYWLQCPDDIAVARCLRRNGQPDAFLISEAGFWDLKTRFQPPTPEEMAEIMQCRHEA